MIKRLKKKNQYKRERKQKKTENFKKYKILTKTIF